MLFIILVIVDIRDKVNLLQKKTTQTHSENDKQIEVKPEHMKIHFEKNVFN